jgi:outer membrane protein insertion porin family
MPISDQEEIVASIKRQKYAYPLDGVVEEALERLRAGWQNQGYFKVQVNGDAKTVTTSETSIQLALFAHVEENSQYRLGGITFKNNRVLSNSAKLRDLFPVKDGDIFSRENVAKGLENLRKAYGEYGYINYNGVPSTTFDDERKLAFLEIDIDEGKLFYVSRINVEGIGAPPQQQVLKELALKPGDIWNSRLWELSLRRVASEFTHCVCPSDNPKQLDERTGTVALTLDFRPCSLR